MRDVPVVPAVRFGSAPTPTRSSRAARGVARLSSRGRWRPPGRSWFGGPRPTPWSVAAGHHHAMRAKCQRVLHRQRPSRSPIKCCCPPPAERWRTGTWTCTHGDGRAVWLSTTTRGADHQPCTSTPPRCFPGTGCRTRLGRRRRWYAVNVLAARGTEDAGVFGRLTRARCRCCAPQAGGASTQHGCDNPGIDPLAHLSLSVDWAGGRPLDDARLWRTNCAAWAAGSRPVGRRVRARPGVPRTWTLLRRRGRGVRSDQ